MCGIAGYIDSSISKDSFIKAIECLSHRGPDGSGFFWGEEVALGHKRLSIIDLSELAGQPYHYGNLILVFNGELYNYKEIRADLTKEGYSFDSNSDTEVLIKAFHRWKERAVDRFIGMFAFAVYDKSSKELYLFRDRLGVKPLYYSTINGLIFGSEIKFFKKLPYQFSINKIAVTEFFRFGYPTNQNSIFQEINKLLPGHFLHYSKGNIKIVEYWRPEPQGSLFKNEAEVVESLENLLISSFKYRMVSDVPVGIFLSGGIDSSLVSSILQKNYGNINTFTIGFNNDRYNEAPFASAIAKELGTNHYESILTEELAKDLFFKFYDIYDEPSSDSSGIPTSHVSFFAKQNNMKVVLSADGGDELFCGYPHYNKIHNLYLKIALSFNKTKPAQKALINLLAKSQFVNNLNIYNLNHKIFTYQDLLLSNDMISFYEHAISNQSEAELEQLLPLANKFSSSRFKFNHERSEIENMAHWDLLHYLPDDLLVKVDRATMYAGIEGREPFLDHRLVEFSLNLPLKYKIKEGNNKYILKKILSKYVKPELFERPKRGFSIPIMQWLNGDLKFLFDEYLTKENIESTQLLNTKVVLNEYKKFKHFSAKGKEYNIEKMWRILSFMMWWKKWNN